MTKCLSCRIGRHLGFGNLKIFKRFYFLELIFTFVLSLEKIKHNRMLNFFTKQE